MDSNEEYLVLLLNNIIRYTFQYVVSLLYILGNLGNAFSAWIFLQRAWRKNVCVFYFNICLLFNTCYINGTLLGSIFTLGFNINLHNSFTSLCKLFYYTALVFSTLFPTVLFLASLDRLLISSHNVDTRLYSSKRLAYVLITISTLFWSLFFIHALVKVDIQELYPSYFVCYYDQSVAYTQFALYSGLIINLLLIIPMIFLLIVTFRNVHRIRAIPRQQRQQIRSMTKKDLQLLRCLFVQDVIYVIFSIPINIFYVVQALPRDRPPTPMEQAIGYFFNLFSTFLHHIPYCVGFFVFITLSRGFRNEFKRLIWSICGKPVAPLREEENPERNVVAVVTEVA